MGIRASIAVAGGASMCAVLLLALLSPEGNEGNRGLIPVKAVFRNTSEHYLSSQTIVDQLMELQLSEQIHNVGWSNAVLSVDLAAAPDWSTKDKASLYSDISKLVRFSFWDVHNVNRLQIRFLDLKKTERGSVEIEHFGNNEEILLLSADIRKSDVWIAAQTIPDDAQALQTLKWQSRLRIHVTKAWERQAL